MSRRGSVPRRGVRVPDINPRLARRLPAGVLVLAVLALALTAGRGGEGERGPAAAEAATSQPAGAARTTEAAPWRFVSIPDFLNNDVDYPDPAWDSALDPFLDAVAAEEPDFVIVPGDLVMGHWWESEETVDALASQYYGAWQKRMAAHDLTAYPAVGDHEVGDNPWTPARAALVPAMKAAFARELATPVNGPAGQRGTAYEVTHKNLTLLAVDQFDAGPGRGMTLGVGGDQLEWLRDRLAERETGHVVVMGGLPVLPAPRIRSSSGDSEPGGAGAPLWSALREGRVGLYMSGEQHDVNVAAKDGVVQVINGSQPGVVPELNYLVVTVHPDRFELELKTLALEITEGSELQAGGLRTRPELVTISDAERERGPQPAGAMTVATDGSGAARVTATSGLLAERFSDLD